MVSLFWLLVVTLMSILGNSFSPQRALTRTTVVKAQSLRQTVMALTNEDAEVESSTTRRGALRSILGLVQGTLIFDSFDPKSATALDMDAFINSQVNLYSYALFLVKVIFQSLIVYLAARRRYKELRSEQE
jgi:hypothetical protein